MTKKILLGNEYDDGLRRAINEVLLKQGSTELSRSWGVVGSQEVETIKFRMCGELITLESETFIGISLQGQESVVEGLAKKIKQTAKDHP